MTDAARDTDRCGRGDDNDPSSGANTNEEE
jgi:hypothetical protein